jgi:hypothetical protein
MEWQATGPRRMSWPASLAVSLAATAVALRLMFWARTAFQIRTLPERVMEWALLFVPLAAFEKGVQELGPQAKEIALGALALRWSWPGWAVLGLGPFLWLVAMGVIMPMTGAGLFARDLLAQNVPLVNASYLGVALAYATILLLGRRLAPPRHDREGSARRVPRPLNVRGNDIWLRPGAGRRSGGCHPRGLTGVPQRYDRIPPPDRRQTRLTMPCWFESTDANGR